MATKGRKSKTVEALRAKAFPDDIASQKANIFQVDVGLPIVEGDSVADKELGLTSLVTDRVDRLLANPKVTLKSPSLKRPWVLEETPEKMLARLRQEAFMNGRIIETLELHLAMHIVAQGSIDRQMVVAQDQFVGDMDDIGATLRDFIRKLSFVGLKAAAVQAMSMSDLSLLADLLNNRGSLSPAEMAHIFGKLARQSNRATAAQIEESDALSREIRAKAEAERVEPEEPVVLDPEPVLPLYGQEWIDVSVRVPTAFWCSDLEFDMPYRWEYRSATVEEYAEVIAIPFPPADSWVRMVKRDPEFRKAFRDEVVDLVMTADLLRSYLGHVYGEEYENVPLNSVKAWLYLLWARTQPDNVRALMGEEHRTYFAGVKIPVETMGGLMIRELAPIAE